MDSDQGKIFVGGISWETTEERLKDYFNDFGSVVETVIMKDRATGRARGFGFVAFADPAVADRVLLEKHTIEGRMVEVKKAVPREEQQNLPRSNNAAPVSGNLNRTKKIFVGGLASSVTEEDFRNYFSQFGNITDVVVMYDSNTKRPRGFGFITFDSEDAVEKVIQQKTFHEIHDKLVEVKKAVPREFSAGGTGGSGFESGQGAPYNTGYAQGSNPSSGNGYSGPRYAPPPGGRGGYPSYVPAAYGTPGYGTTPGYGVPMNGAYGTAAYGGGTGYPPAGAYGAGYGSAPATGYGGAAGYGAPVVPSGGYVSAPPVGPRSPWGNSGTGFAGGGSPAAYGAGGVAGMSGYGAPAWNTGGAAPQANGGNAGYNSVGYGFGTNDAGHNNVAGYPARSMASGPGGYGDPYAAAQYGDTTWKSGESHNSLAAASGAGTAAGYAGGMNPSAGGMVAGPATDASGYGVAGRQTQRGPDARFRPYPATGERSV